MPDMDGFETAQKLKEDITVKEIPIIFITAKNNIEDIQKGFDSGGFDYIMKPFNNTELLARVKTHVNLKKAMDNIKKLSTAVEQSASSIIITDINGIIEYVNKKVTSISGYNKNELIGANPRLFKSGKQTKEYYMKLWDTILSGTEWNGEFCNKSKSGALYWELSTITPIRNDSGEVINFIGIQEDITLRKQMEEKLRIHATTDNMTGLFNRRFGLEILDKEMQLIKRQNGSLVIIFIDANNLKLANDKFGHHEGDSLLLIISESLKKYLRNSDTLCRLGGDEFLIILPDCNIEQASEIWKRIQQNFDEINKSKIKPYPVTVSHGFGLYNPKSEDIDLDQLVARADEAMYEDKQISKKLKE